MIAAGRHLRAFHGLVAGTVERLENASWPAQGSPDIEPLRQPLLAAIDAMELRMGEEPAEDPAVAHQVLYLLAVYADDRAMAAIWPGRRLWAAQRIESELFGSALGAAEIEARCERLLTVPTPENRQLARLFLYAFGLGLGSADDGEADRLAGLRRRLLDFARPARQPAVPGRRHLFRQAYRYTATRGERRLLPDLRKWLAVAVALLLVFALISIVAWEGAVEGIREALSSPPAGSLSSPADPPADQAAPGSSPSESEPTANRPEVRPISTGPGEVDA